MNPDLNIMDDDHETAAEAFERGRAETEPGPLGWGVVLLVGIGAALYWALAGEHTAVVCAAGFVIRNKSAHGIEIDSAAVFVIRTSDTERLERVDSSALDIGLLIASGAMEPPHVAPQALTVSRWQRMRRWLRARLGRWIYR